MLHVLDFIHHVVTVAYIGPVKIEFPALTQQAFALKIKGGQGWSLIYALPPPNEKFVVSLHCMYLIYFRLSYSTKKCKGKVYYLISNKLKTILAKVLQF